MNYRILSIIKFLRLKREGGGGGLLDGEGLFERGLN